MKKPLTTVIIIVLLILLASAIVYSVSDSYLPGELFKDNGTAGRCEIAASFNDEVITVEDLEQEMELNKLSSGSEEKSELDTLNSLILNLILLTEAEKMGQQARSDEIMEFVSSQKELYNDFPEIAATVDDYCKGADMTLEEYWVDLEERAPRVIARNKVKNAFYEEFLAEIDLKPGEFVTTEDREKIEVAYDNYCSGLLEQYRENIIYNIETDAIIKN